MRKKHKDYMLYLEGEIVKLTDDVRELYNIFNGVCTECQKKAQWRL